jgi:hypothetical protein
VTGRALVVRGNALQLPLPDACVDVCITSPPFWALRDYQTPGQLGSEPTPQEFLDNLWAATREMVRVLKPTGSIFVDLGDKYSTGNSGESGIEQLGARYSGGGHTDGQAKQRSGRVQGMPPKSLLLLPERYRVGCVDQLGLIARAVIIHDKPNGLPEPVRDRVRRSHEDWVHLVKQPRYYSAIDEVRMPYSAKTFTVSTSPRRSDTETAGDKRNKWHTDNGVSREDMIHPLGALPGSVWSIPSEPLDLPGYFTLRDGQLLDFLAPERGGRRPRQGGHPPGLFDPNAYSEVLASGDGPAWQWLRATGINRSPWPQDDTALQLRVAASHYAAFPSAWPRQLILGWSPPGICLECDTGRVPVVDREREQTRKGTDAIRGPNDGSVIPQSGGDGFGQRAETTATILGYACACTPYTDHPERAQGRGFIPDPSDKIAGASANGSERNKAYRESLKRPSQPVREYHLDGWRPPPTRPALILDPFGGTGTVAMVARALGRHAVSVDLSHAYSRAAKWRVTSDNAAKAISRTNAERQGSLL